MVKQMSEEQIEKVKRPRGRPKLDPGDLGRRANVYLAQDVDAWLKKQPGGASKAIARLVRQAIKDERS
jgi:hypothetical protein